MIGRWKWAGVVILVGLAGCGGSPPPAPVDTGSREAIGVYFGGVLRQEWQSAYGVLHPDTQKRCTMEQFVLRATTYRKKIGFELERLHIRSCEEHGPEAIAHVVLMSRSPGHKRRYSEGVVLRQHAGSWRIVLPSNFGR